MSDTLKLLGEYIDAHSSHLLLSAHAGPVTPAESDAFAKAMRLGDELRAHIAELEAGAASLVSSAPSAQPEEGQEP